MIRIELSGYRIEEIVARVIGMIPTGALEEEFRKRLAECGLTCKVLFAAEEGRDVKTP